MGLAPLGLSGAPRRSALPSSLRCFVAALVREDPTARRTLRLIELVEINHVCFARFAGGHIPAVRPQEAARTQGDPMTSNAPTSTTAKPGRTLSIIGAVLAVIALVLLPIVLGPIGAVLGFVGYSKGDKPFGMYVGIGAIVATIIGMVLGAAVMSNMS
jgi:hypothetical protein